MFWFARQRNSAMDFHIDTDDANAFLLKQGQLVERILAGARKKRSSCLGPEAGGSKQMILEVGGLGAWKCDIDTQNGESDRL